MEIDVAVLGSFVHGAEAIEDSLFLEAAVEIGVLNRLQRFLDLCSEMDRGQLPGRRVESNRNVC